MTVRLLRGDGPAAGQARLIRRQDRERVKALGNSVVPRIPEILGRALLDGWT